MCEPDMRGPALTGGGAVGGRGCNEERRSWKMPPRGPPLSDHQAEVTDFYFGRSLEEMSAATAEALSRSPLTFPCLHTERVVCVHECGTVRSLAPRNKGLAAGTSSPTASLTFQNPIGPSWVP